MNILVIGSGGREHAIIWALSKYLQSPSRLICAPGNSGIAELAECVEIDALDINALASFADENQVHMTIVGSEAPLAIGIVDLFEQRGLAIAGANRAAARLESSKAFAKEFMARHEIRTAHYRIAESRGEGRTILRSGEFGSQDTPVVIKADGLAAGKGVVVASTHAEAEDAIDFLIADKDPSGKKSLVVIEEALVGPEASLLLFADGRDYALMPPARDHKRVGENDTGPNTGGMGAVTDSAVIDDETLRRVVREIVEPTLEGARKEGFAFRGVLFVGLMLTADGPRVLEYNVRLGDPEAQAILVRLESSLLEVYEAVAKGKLGQTRVRWSDDASACVVLASRGYPGQPEVGARISGLDRTRQLEAVEVFHAGTKRSADGGWITAGGRVLGITATGQDLGMALSRCYDAVYDISWDGMQFRRDIGRC